VLFTSDKVRPFQFEAFNQATLGFSCGFARSFVSELTLYSQKKLAALLRHCGFDDRMAFLGYAARLITPGCFPAESVLYANFVTHMFPLFYEIKYLNNSVTGRYGSAPWQDGEITARISEMRSNQEVDVFALHSWEGSV
jgi:hypothetical protein